MKNLFRVLSLRGENRTIRSMFFIRLIEEWRKNVDNNYFIGAVLMNLSKAFDCIPHDLVIVKLAAYKFDKNMICCIYSYLNSRKQRVKVNNIKSTFEEIISGSPQGSIVGPILFKVFLNDFFYFVLVASAHNFADDNPLSSFANSGIRKSNSNKLA